VKESQEQGCQLEQAEESCLQKDREIQELEQRIEALEDERRQD